MDRRSFSCQIFEGEQEAEAFRDEYPVGKHLNDEEAPRPIEFRELFIGDADEHNIIFGAGGDPDAGAIFDCLVAAGVIDERNFKISEKVLNWAGPDRIAWARAREPENWACLVEMEYCTYHFPRSSLAYMSAQYQMNYYILQDDYSAGYLMREIEVILGGAETLAEQALSTRKSAGQAGRLASQSAKRKRLLMFMAAIENLGDLVGRMAEQAIVDQAFQNAIEQDQVLWRQGSGQQAEYETVLRSDPEYRARYQSVFSQTA
tara:strand:- start:4415 stop:5197 length:783 start_codon:yes stop_codon:yes gene_type:complete